jgi:hypothetical protein
MTDDTLEGRRKRGGKPTGSRVADMEAIIKAGESRGLAVESASVDEYGDMPSISVRFRRGKKKTGPKVTHG